MLRVDQPDQRHVFGVAEYGRPSDFLDTAGNTRRSTTSPSLPDRTRPTSTPSRPAPAGTGLRPRASAPRSSTTTAARPPTSTTIDRRPACRLPLALPQSLTVDQFQSYNGADDADQTRRPPTTGSASSSATSRATRSRTSAKSAAMLHMVDSNVQVLLTKPCADQHRQPERHAPPVNCPAEHMRGVPLPGELGITLYLREKKIENPIPDTLRTSTFIQIDGRVSTEIDAGVRLLGNGVEVSPGIHLGYVEAALRGLPGHLTGTRDQPHHPVVPGARGDHLRQGHRPPPLGFPLTCVNLRSGSTRCTADIDLSPDDHHRPPRRRCDLHRRRHQARRRHPGLFRDARPGTSGRGTVVVELAADIDPLDLLCARPSWSTSATSTSSASSGSTSSSTLPDWLEAVLDFIEDALGWSSSGAIVDVVEAVINSIASRSRCRPRCSSSSRSTGSTHFSSGRTCCTCRPDADGAIRVRHRRSHQPRHGRLPGRRAVRPQRRHPRLDRLVPRGARPDHHQRAAPRSASTTRTHRSSTRSPGRRSTCAPRRCSGENLLLDYRSCSNIITQLIPFSGNIETLSLNQITLPGPFGSDLDFILWPLTDPRMKVGGLLMPIVGGMIFDALLDVFGGVAAVQHRVSVDGRHLRHGRHRHRHRRPTTTTRATARPRRSRAIRCRASPVTRGSSRRRSTTRTCLARPSRRHPKPVSPGPGRGPHAADRLPRRCTAGRPRPSAPRYRAVRRPRVQRR